MTDEKVKVIDNADEIIKAGLEWIDGNAKKNAGAKEERDAKKKLSLLVKDDLVSIEIGPNLMLDIGSITEESEEIDAKLLFKNNPEAFWALVDIPKTAAIAMLGEAGTAKVSRPVTKVSYKVKKRKIT